MELTDEILEAVADEASGKGIVQCYSRETMRTIYRAIAQRALEAAADCCESLPRHYEQHAECAAAIRAMARCYGWCAPTTRRVKELASPLQLMLAAKRKGLQRGTVACCPTPKLRGLAKQVPLQRLVRQRAEMDRCNESGCCAHLNKRLRDEKGFKALHTINTADQTQVEPRFFGVAYKLSMKDRGLMLNFCPFCGGHPGYYKPPEDVLSNASLSGGFAAKGNSDE